MTRRPIESMSTASTKRPHRRAFVAATLSIAGERVNADGPARGQIQEQLEPTSGAAAQIEDLLAGQIRQQRFERAFLESK